MIWTIFVIFDVNYDFHASEMTIGIPLSEYHHCALRILDSFHVWHQNLTKIENFEGIQKGPLSSLFQLKSL